MLHVDERAVQRSEFDTKVSKLPLCFLYWLSLEHVVCDADKSVIIDTYGRYIKMFIYFVCDADKRKRKYLQKVERGERIRAKGTDIFPAA